jgi:hypothetical protein
MLVTASYHQPDITAYVTTAANFFAQFTQYKLPYSVICRHIPYYIRKQIYLRHLHLTYPESYSGLFTCLLSTALSSLPASFLFQEFL